MFKNFRNKFTYNFVKTYVFIFCIFSSDTSQELMFVYHTVSELCFYGCFHPCNSIGTIIIKSLLSPPSLATYTRSMVKHCTLRIQILYFKACYNVTIYLYVSIILSRTMSVCPSVCLSVRLSLKISVTTEPIGFYSSGNISTSPVVVLSYFLGG